MRRVKWPRMTLPGRIVLFLTVFAVAMALQIGIGYYQTNYVLEPLEKRSESMQTISREEFDTPDLDESRNDETGHTAKAINEMKHSMKRQVELLNKKSAVEGRLYAKELEALELQTLMERESQVCLYSNSCLDVHALAEGRVFP